MSRSWGDTSLASQKVAAESGPVTTKRTSLEAFVGRRYDSMTYYGTFAYAPNSRESVTVSVYDGISRENLPDFLAASALLGLRYSFF